MERPGTRITGIVEAPGTDHRQRASGESDALFEMIEERLDFLTAKLGGPYKATDLQADVDSLSSLVQTRYTPIPSIV
jgi:hypothetical protein